MALILEKDVDGALQAIEKTVCDYAYTPDAITYYLGFLAYVPHANLANPDNANVGVYADAGKAVQLTVLQDAVPPDVNNVMVDMQNGVIWSTTNRSVWVDYYAHTSINYYPAQPLNFYIPERLTDGVAPLELRRFRVAQFQKFGFCSLHVWGETTANVLTFTLKNAPAGGDEQTVVLASGVSHPAVYQFTSPFKLTAAQEGVIDVDDGKDLCGIDLRFWGW